MIDQWSHPVFPTREVFEARVKELRDAEKDNPPGWWWLSFVDVTRPEGDRFLGVIIVKARGFTSAVELTHDLGVNPGGEVQGCPFQTGPFDESLVGRLLSRKELYAAGLDEEE